jgi:hypothetical protein
MQAVYFGMFYSLVGGFSMEYHLYTARSVCFTLATLSFLASAYFVVVNDD